MKASWSCIFIDLLSYWFLCVRHVNTVCPNKKENPFYHAVRYLHWHARFNETIYLIIKGIFSSFIWYQTHDDISMRDWKGIIWTHACQNRFAQNDGVEFDMTKSRLAYPCQNKESKQKKHDKRDERNANECLFNTSLCSEMWQTPFPMPRKSILTSPFEMVHARPCMANRSCNWCQKKEHKLNFVTM